MLQLGEIYQMFSLIFVREGARTITAERDLVFVHPMLSFISGSQCVNPQASADNKKMDRVNCGFSYPTLWYRRYLHDTLQCSMYGICQRTCTQYINLTTYNNTINTGPSNEAES